MIIQGVAGTGKSFVIKTLKHFLQEKLMICAFTGCASHNIKGQTIHSILKLNTDLDFFAHILYSLGLFFTILVFTMYKNYINIKFFISWWAFTFPMASITLATILMYELTSYWFYGLLSYILMLITSIIVYLVASQTLAHMMKKEICILE